VSPLSGEGGLTPAESLKDWRVCALAGIARPEQFEATLQALGARVDLSIGVADHHRYSVDELLRVFARCRQQGIHRIVTTAKDAVRFPSSFIPILGEDREGMEIWILEVLLEFDPDEGEFYHRVDSLLAR
jgi:tetraacyldisaccharide-1-P 4'-kinase